MRKLLLPMLLVAGLMVGGCARLQAVFDILTAAEAAEVPATAVIVAANTFDALEVTATNYLRLKRCTEKTRPVCREPAATAVIVPAVRSGRIARDNLKKFLRENPGKLGPSGLYNALSVASNTLTAIYAQYNIQAIGVR